jgi:hypothetical protein
MIDVAEGYSAKRGCSLGERPRCSDEEEMEEKVQKYKEGATHI